MRRFILICLAAGFALVLSTGLVFAFLVPDVEPTIERSLEELLPQHIPGWQSTNVPLSQTPEGEERVLAVLDLDDVFCRQYTKGDTEIMVYVAYWYPGSEPYSSVAIHNPDSCWVIAGWDVLERESNRSRKMAGYPLKEHEWGVYRKDGNEVYVIFWHLLGGEPNKHIKNMIWTSSGWDSFKRQFYFIYNMYQMGFDLGQDQLFVRISSNKPFEQIEESGELDEILSALDGLGLTRANAGIEN
ncbi:MAG TPA: exosortase-associated EpsI family protein [Opitutales bacterium]|nr:exosortase-associated EpsI family protein [Opitutales bacterium]